jgi:dCMP deaminase
LTAPKGICAGKHTIAEYLIQHEGFQLLELKNKTSPQVADGPEDDLLLQASEYPQREGHQSPQLSFDSPDALLDFATKQWQGLWVTTDIWEGVDLDRFLQRPFFLLVSVDAPVSLRWKRFAER